MDKQELSLATLIMDHESRIRALEKLAWKLVGGIIVGSAVGTAIGGAIVARLFGG